MSRLKLVLGLAVSICGCDALAAPPEPDFGAPVSAADLAPLVAIPPDGAGLPPGHGDATQGAAVFAARCAACHGDNLQGVKAASGPPLIGGRGTLATAKPLKTVESYWPYATTLFDYVRRAMPFNAPGSLSDDEVYAVSAYILERAHVIGEGEALDRTSLPKVEMPNRAGFYPDPRPR